MARLLKTIKWDKVTAEINDVLVKDKGAVVTVYVGMLSDGDIVKFDISSETGRVNALQVVSAYFTKGTIIDRVALEDILDREREIRERLYDIKDDRPDAVVNVVDEHYSIIPAVAMLEGILQDEAVKVTELEPMLYQVTLGTMSMIVLGTHEDYINKYSELYVFNEGSYLGMTEDVFDDDRLEGFLEYSV